VTQATVHTSAITFGEFMWILSCGALAGFWWREVVDFMPKLLDYVWHAWVGAITVLLR